MGAGTRNSGELLTFQRQTASSRDARPPQLGQLCSPGAWGVRAAGPSPAAFVRRAASRTRARAGLAGPRGQASPGPAARRGWAGALRCLSTSSWMGRRPEAPVPEVGVEGGGLSAGPPRGVSWAHTAPSLCLCRALSCLRNGMVAGGRACLRLLGVSRAPGGRGRRAGTRRGRRAGCCHRAFNGTLIGFDVAFSSHC